MPSLARFQESFVRGLTAAAPLPGIFATPAFAVYRNTWRKALVDALRDAYPVVAALIGPDAFQALALEFIGKRAAPSPILANWGEGFAEFIAAHSLNIDVPYLADAARLERLATEAHLGPDADPLEPTRFVELREEAMDEDIALHPAARFGWFETPAVTIWEAHQGPDQLQSFAPDWVPEGALVTRPQGRVVVTRIDRETYRLLAGIRAGEALLTAADATGNADVTASLLLLAKTGAFVNPSKKEELRDGHKFW